MAVRTASGTTWNGAPTTALRRARRVLGAGPDSGFLVGGLFSEAHGPVRVLPGGAHRRALPKTHDAELVLAGVRQALVRHAVLGEVEPLGVEACFLEGGLVDVVVVVDKPAVGHVPAVGAVPPGRELVSVPGAFVSNLSYCFKQIMPRRDLISGLTRQDQ